MVQSYIMVILRAMREQAVLNWWIGAGITRYILITRIVFWTALSDSLYGSGSIW